MTLVCCLAPLSTHTESARGTTRLDAVANANRVYLLGAGFSIAISDSGSTATSLRMPSLQQLSDAVIEKLKGAPSRRLIKTSTEETAYAKTNELVAILQGIPDHRDLIRETYEAVIGVYNEAYLPGAGTPLVRNFEQWLSYLIDAPPWLTAAEQMRNRAAFLEISYTVYEVLNERQLVTVSTQKKCPDWLSQLVRHWEQQASSVLTFNYDQFVELAWLVNVKRTPSRMRSWDLYPAPVTPLNAQMGASPASYGPVDQFQLFKMHGSIGWWYSGPDSPPSDVVYDQGLQGSAWSGRGLYAFGETSIPTMADHLPMIVPPAAVKNSYYNNATLKAIWRKAAAALTGADELVIMGFSLPATDMLVSSMLCTNLRNDCRIVPVDYGDGIVQRVCDTFGISTDDRRLDTRYVNLKQEAIPRWVEDHAAPVAI